MSPNSIVTYSKIRRGYIVLAVDTVLIYIYIFMYLTCNVYGGIRNTSFFLLVAHEVIGYSLNPRLVVFKMNKNFEFAK